MRRPTTKNLIRHIYDNYSELQRLRLAYKRLSEMHLEFGTGPIHVREMAIRGILDSSLEVLQEMKVPNFREGILKAQTKGGRT